MSVLLLHSKHEADLYRLPTQSPPTPAFKTNIMRNLATQPASEGESSIPQAELDAKAFDRDTRQWIPTMKVLVDLTQQLFLVNLIVLR